MRKTVLCLIMAIAMYGAYMYTLPAVTDNELAAVSGEAQITAQITLPEKRLYAVSLGTYDTEDEARPDAAAYALRGAAGLIHETNDGWAILGAGYSTEGEAGSVCSQLRANEDISAQVILFDTDEVRISLTATRTQTEAITAALDMLEDMPSALMQLAAQLDGGSLNTATARTLVSVGYSDACAARDALTSALGTTADIFARLVETEIMELCDSLEIISSEAGPRGLSFSSWLKQCALETDLGIICMMDALRR